MDSNFKDVYIGKIIKQKVDESRISYAEFARQIHCARTSLYHIFESKNIDIERLLLISKVLHYDFIREIYLNKTTNNETLQPYIILPLKNKTIDTTQLPEEIIMLLKKELI